MIFQNVLITIAIIILFLIFWNFSKLYKRVKYMINDIHTKALKNENEINSIKSKLSESTHVINDVDELVGVDSELDKALSAILSNDIMNNKFDKIEEVEEVVEEVVEELVEESQPVDDIDLTTKSVEEVITSIDEELKHNTDTVNMTDDTVTEEVPLVVKKRAGRGKKII